MPPKLLFCCPVAWIQRLLLPRRSRQRLTSTVNYRQRWQEYSRGIVTADSVQRDRLVARRAFAAGMSHKEIALMLSAGSPYVKEIVRREGKARIDPLLRMQRSTQWTGFCYFFCLTDSLTAQALSIPENKLRIE